MPALNPFHTGPGTSQTAADRPWLKICGVTDRRNAFEAAEAGADMIGLNLWPGSRRYLAREHHQWAVDLGDRVPLVGVFVNEDAAAIRQLAGDLRLSAIQLHGDESPEFAAELSRSTGLPVIKAVSPDRQGLSSGWQDFPWLLLDAHDPLLRGGTGRTVDWAAAASTIRNHPASRFLLAGGLRPDNADEALDMVNPWAIDVASGAETSPGLKDPAKISALASLVRGRLG